MGIPAESAYADGFVDGQEDILDEISDIIETWNSAHSDDMALTISMIQDLINEKKREIESL